jgi:hypothetical protein
MSPPWLRAANVCSGSILLKKSFGGAERNFLGQLTRFMRGDVRDHVASQKNDHGASYRRYEASKPWSRPKINICEIFGVVRFSTTLLSRAYVSGTPITDIARPAQNQIEH